MPQPIPVIQPAFGSGEISPSLFGRVDVAKYHAALRTARNVNVMPQGGIRNRAGTRMVAAAKDSAHPVRTIPFSASSTQSYTLEFGHLYIRVYDTSYNLQADFVSPYSGADLFSLKFSQSADVLFIAGGAKGYAPRTLTFFAANSWTIALYVNKNGPFIVQNTDTTSTITPSGLSGTVTLTATKSIFNANQVGGLFQLVQTISGQTIAPQLTAAAQNWIAVGSAWQVVLTGTWTGTILIQTSLDNLNWTTVSSVSANGTYNGSTGFSTYGFIRAVMQSGISFTGSASVVISDSGTTTGPTNLASLSAVTGNVAAGDTIKTTITGTWTGTITVERSDDGGNTWTLVTTYTTNQAATSQALSPTIATTCLVRARMSAFTSGTAAVTLDGTAGTAPTHSYTISTASVSVAILAGATWSFITNGTWTGKVRVEISTDGGNNWQLVHTFQSANSGNENTTGQSGAQQCLLRVSTDPSVAFSGTVTVDLSSTGFDWTNTVQIASYVSATQVTATVLNNVFSNTDSTGLPNTSSTWQWSEGSWSVYRGYPASVSFYQDRLCWGGTQGSEPNTAWMTDIGDYYGFLVHEPIQDDDSIAVVLPGRKLNSVQSMVQMLNVLLALTSDAEFSVGPASGTGAITPSSVDQELQGHRGSAFIDPVVVGPEVILIQQMGTIVRNLIFQLAVNGYYGDDISYTARHLFIGFSVIEMAYQAEPDSIIWMVRSDGQLLSTTYIKEQELNAWTHHDTNGLFESVCTIPNATLGLNEVWLVVNRNGTRYIEVLRPRDQGTDPKQQWFVDCGIKIVNGSPQTVITGLGYLNGYTVAINADGNVVSPRVVAGGQITLDVAATTVIVGLPYVSDVETLPMESYAGGAFGGKTMQAQRNALARVFLRTLTSRSLYYAAVSEASVVASSGTAGFRQVIERTAAMHMDQAIPLGSMPTDQALILGGGFDLQARVFLRQVDPMPFTLLAVTPEVAPSGR